jgi:glycosyltransferase involved in cell wall biosynthesis
VVSDAAGAKCVDGETGLIHRVGDVAGLTRHLTRLINEPDLLSRLRRGVLAQRDRLTWAAAAERLEQCYEEAMAAKAQT